MLFILAVILLAVSVLIYINSKKSGGIKESKISLIGIAIGSGKNGLPIILNQ